jgi:tetratricopeptide (TPR) repeat protein
MDVGVWLRTLGLEQYEPVFRQNEIDDEVLPELTDPDLEKLGVPMGHRKRLVRAIARLSAAELTAAPIPAVASTAKRRQLTVMFCDLVGSTALSARLDPEDLRAVIRAYHRCVAAVVERAGGFVAKYMGDGVLAYFGYPRADEHDAERAVRAGLQLVEAVAGLDTAAEKRLEVRVGIATGLVVVGDLIGEGEARERGAESRFEALRATRTPLVGRDEELALLHRRWQQAKGGDGSIVLLSGEPGIGKSRLAETLLERLSGEPHIRLRLFCSPHHQDHALYPTLAQLERAAGFRREDTAAQRLDKLEAVLGQGTNDVGGTAPLLAALLSLPAGVRYPPLDLTPEKQKEQTLRALAAQVEGLAARQPVLMLFEDAHWSDPPSLELLDLIVDRVPALPVLLIITFRPEFTAPWTGRPHVTALGLNRLAPRQQAEMIAGVTGGKALPQEVTEQIVDGTDGVPLFVEELTKAVVESGMLSDLGDHYTAAGPVAHLAIPASLQASLLARLDRQAPAREVAQIGATLGRQFSHDLIAAVAGMPPRQLDDAQARLVGAELIYRRGIPPDAEYSFKHALVQDAAYGTLLRSRRQQLHAHIGATLEDRFPEIAAAQPALLAHHYQEGGLTEKAVEYWLAAGRQAWARSATAEAVALLRRGLAQVPALPDDDRRRETEFDLQIAFGQALIANQGWGAPELAEVYSRARALAATLSRPHALLFARWGQWVYECCRTGPGPARPLAAELRQLGEAVGDVPMQVMGCIACGVTGFWLGETDTGRAYLDEGLGLYDPAYRSLHAELLPFDPLVELLLRSSWPLACLGHLVQALSRCDAALDEARRLSHPPTLAWAAGGAGWCVGSFVRLEPGSLLQYADQMLELTITHELGFHRGYALIYRGWSLAALGRADEGIPLLTAGLADSKELGVVAINRPVQLALLGDACRMAGHWQAALAHFAEARHLATETAERWFEAETLRLTGEVLLATGDPSGAEASYHEAIAIAQQQGAKLWELRVATSLARLWRDQGKRMEARDLLAPVYGWFTEGFGTPVLQEAKALLDELSASSGLAIDDGGVAPLPAGAGTA